MKDKNNSNLMLYKVLSKLNAEQFKVFYSIFIHYWANYKFFISKQNLFNLLCELNQLCYEFDESFPDQYDNYEEIRSFCRAYPYYFIDKLPIDMISKLFSEYIDNRIDILTKTAQTLYEVNIFAAYTYANKTLGLNEPVDILVSETQDHIKYFS
ncbi:MAG: hypothetical protein E7536_03135 [Ruminococcaceae bacterium]|nr:hypothetical protein [Oscillospiraceae bacterium]